jgi:hypothetical protein
MPAPIAVNALSERPPSGAAAPAAGAAPAPLESSSFFSCANAGAESVSTSKPIPAMVNNLITLGISLHLSEA